MTPAMKPTIGFFTLECAMKSAASLKPMRPGDWTAGSERHSSGILPVAPRNGRQDARRPRRLEARDPAARDFLDALLLLTFYFLLLFVLPVPFP